VSEYCSTTWQQGGGFESRSYGGLIRISYKKRIRDIGIVGKGDGDDGEHSKDNVIVGWAGRHTTKVCDTPL
jgi:hypothetical protein